MIKLGKQKPDDLPDMTTGSWEEELDEGAQAEFHGARALYRLSLRSPLLLVFGLVVFAPLVIPYRLFTGFRSRHDFVRWHTAQWMLLTLAALCACVIGWGSDLTLLLIAFGGWYLGNHISLGQVRRGDCWLWRWGGQPSQLPRPWALAPHVAPARSTSAPAATPAQALPGPVPASPTSTDRAGPRAAFERGRSLVQQGRRDEAAACFLAAFRTGPPHLRGRALAALENLGEVETF